MNVVVASVNPVKRAAVESAFRSTFPETVLEITTERVPSGVGDQPSSDAETRRGAEQRAANARRKRTDGDYFVGLEGGVDRPGGTLTAFAWIAIYDRSGRLGVARTVSLPLPPSVETLLDSGLELGEAIDRVFDTRGSKRKGGAFGLLTGGLCTRTSVYAEAVTVALVPLINDLYWTDEVSSNQSRQ